MFADSGAAQPVRVRAVDPPRAPQSALTAASAALAKAQRPLFVIGSQAVVQAVQADALAAAVARLGVPVYLSGMARGLLGRDHPLLLRHQRRQALREADCVLLAGVPCDFRLDYGKHVRRNATLIAANRSRRDANLNRKPDIAAIGDAGLFLQDLAGGSARGRKPRDAWVAQLRARDDERESEIERQAADAGEFVNPLMLLRELERTMADDALLVADGGDFVGTASYVLHARGPLGWLDPGAFGTLGVGAGFALGAAIARPRSRGVDRVRRRRVRLRAGGVRHLRAPRHPRHRRGRQRRGLDADRARAGQDAARRRGHRAGPHRLPRRGRRLRRARHRGEARGRGRGRARRGARRGAARASRCW